MPLERLVVAENTLARAPQNLNCTCWKLCGANYPNQASDSFAMALRASSGSLSEWWSLVVSYAYFCGAEVHEISVQRDICSAMKRNGVSEAGPWYSHHSSGTENDKLADNNTRRATVSSVHTRLRSKKSLSLGRTDQGAFQLAIFCLASLVWVRCKHPFQPAGVIKGGSYVLFRLPSFFVHSPAPRRKIIQKRIVIQNHQNYQIYQLGKEIFSYCSLSNSVTLESRIQAEENQFFHHDPSHYNAGPPFGH